MLEHLEDRLAPALTSLNINESPEPFERNGHVNFNGILYFPATDGAGRELWRSDGTAAGTFRFADINPGVLSSNPSEFLVIGQTLYFAAEGATGGNELWKTDGTVAGTVRVKDIVPGAAWSNPSNLTNVNGTLFFIATESWINHSLWKSDGTEAGTEFITGIATSEFSAYLTNVNGTLFFQNSDPANGAELWKSDGTAAGTMLVKNIAPSGGSSNPRDLINFNGTLYFHASDGVTGGELWKSNGTEAGTVLVKDVAPGPVGSIPFEFTFMNGELYFLAFQPNEERKIWKTDGTGVGTVPVTNSPQNIWDLTAVGDQLFYTVNNNLQRELWRSDGTNAGTILLADIGTGSVPAVNADLSAVGDTLYFTATDPVHGIELWKSDGTPAGTGIVADVATGTLSASPARLTNVNGTLFFAANDRSNGLGLWKTTGTTAGTDLVEHLQVDDDSGYTSFYFLDIGGIVYFTGNDGVTGRELYKTDGTSAGTTLVKDIAPGRESGVRIGFLGNFSELDGMLFFNGSGKLWKSDGTSDGTAVVYSALDAAPENLTNVNGTLFFSVRTDLWRSDGTETGTVMFRHFTPGQFTELFFPRFFDWNGTLFFTVSDISSGVELWQTNGTEAGTVRVADINPGGADSNPNGFVVHDGLLYFAATDPVGGTELWKTDGTEAGTMRVADINPGAAGSNPTNLTSIGGALYFAADDGINGRELWKTNGTEAGTVRVADINPGVASSDPKDLVNVNGTLFFTAETPAFGREVWKSNGTEAGTALLKEINSSTGETPPFALVNFNGILAFKAFDPIAGHELWLSDGTEAGTQRMDIVRGSASSNPNFMHTVNNRLYFGGTTPGQGHELFILTNPDADAGGPFSVSEGGSVQLNGSGSSHTLPSDALNYEWDLDGDGIFGEAGPAAIHGSEVGRTPTFLAGDLDGPGAFTVWLRVTASPGNSHTDSAAITITNAAPTATFSNNGPVDEGTSATVSFTNQSDSPEDMAAGFRYAYDFDDNGVWDVGDGTYAGGVPDASVTVPAVYLDDVRSRRVMGRIVDKENAGTNYISVIAINPVDDPPTDIDLRGPRLAAEGAETETLVGKLTTDDKDLSAEGDTHTYTLIESAGGRFKIAGDELRVDNGALIDFQAAATYTVRVRTTDSAGASFEKDFVIAVAPRTLSYQIDKVELPLNAKSPFTFELLQAGSEAWVIDRLQGLFFAGSYSQDYGGANEKWMRAAPRGIVPIPTPWAFIKLNGEVFLWDHSPSSATGTLLGRLDPIYWVYPQMLHDASAEHLAYTVDQFLDLRTDNGNLYENYGGRGERWLLGAPNQFGNPWYFLTPQGRFFAWDGQLFSANGQFLTSFHSVYYQQLQRLHNAQANQISASQIFSPTPVLEINPVDGFVGDWMFALRELIVVPFGGGDPVISFKNTTSIVNHLPELDPIADQSMPTSLDTLAVPLNAADLDPGDIVNFFAKAGHEGFVLDQLYDLHPGTFLPVATADTGLPIDNTGSPGFGALGDHPYFYTNWGGQSEKWLKGLDNEFGNQWYFILPNGELRAWSGAGLGGTLLATLPRAYYQFIELLYKPDAQDFVRALSQRLGLFIDPSGLWQDFLGQGEKWLRGADGAWFYIRPDGQFIRQSGMLLASLDPIYFSELNRFVNAAANQFTVSIAGSDALINPVSFFVGDIWVLIEASDFNPANRRRDTAYFRVMVTA